MYLRQVRQIGVLGLIGYVLFALGYLAIMCIAFVAAYVLPDIAASNTGYVNDVIAADTSRGTVRRHRHASQAVTPGESASPTWSAASSSASRCTGPASCPAGQPPCSPSAASPPPRSR